jgi:hypothetical protein
VSFRISAPADWEVQQDKGPLRWVAVSPLQGAGDTFRENMNVVLDGLVRPVELSEYYEAQLGQLEQGFQGFRVVSTEERAMAGQRAMRLIYEHTLGARTIRGVTYFFVLPDRAVALTGTAVAAQFDAYFPTFEAMASSFRF